MWVDSRGGVGVSLPFTNASGKENWKELDICEQELTNMSSEGSVRGLHPVTSVLKEYDQLCAFVK